MLNTAPEKRLATRDEAVAAFPYVNGNLFIDNKRVYLFGASLKDLGKKCFCAMKVEGADIAALKALT